LADGRPARRRATHHDSLERRVRRLRGAAGPLRRRRGRTASSDLQQRPRGRDRGTLMRLLASIAFTAAVLGSLSGCRPQREAPAPRGGLMLGPVALANATYIVGIPGGLDTVTLADGRHLDETTGLETVLLPVAAW